MYYKERKNILLINIYDNYNFISESIIHGKSVQRNSSRVTKDKDTSIKDKIDKLKINYKGYEYDIYYNVILASYYIRDNDIKAALEIYKNTYLNNKESLRLYFNYGVIEMLNRNYVIAEKIFTDCLNEQYTHDYAINNIIVLNILNGGKLNHSYNNLKTYSLNYNLGLYLYNRGEYINSLNCLLSAKMIFPSDKYINEYIALCYAAMGNIQIAERYIKLDEIYKKWKDDKTTELHFKGMLLKSK